MSKNRFNGQHYGAERDPAPKYNKPSRNEKPQRPEPVYDQVQLDLADMIKGQIDVFMGNQAYVDDMSYEERRTAENQLFSLPEYPCKLGMCTDCSAYVVNRSVRVDRETHLLTRASCTIVLINNDTHAPAYILEAFLNTTGGGIVVVPQGENGPVLRNTYRMNIKM